MHANLSTDWVDDHYLIYSMFLFACFYKCITIYGMPKIYAVELSR